MDEYNNQNPYPDKPDDHDRGSAPDSPYDNSRGGWQEQQQQSWRNGPAGSPQDGGWQNQQPGGQWQNNQNSGQWQNNQPDGQWQSNQSGGQWQNNQNGGQWQNNQNGGQWQNNQNGGQWQNNQPYGQPPRQRNGQALASMIFGILALLACCIPFVQFPLAVVAIVLVILSKKKQPLTGFAIAGLVLGIISIVMSIAMTFYWGYAISLMNDPEFMKIYNDMMNMQP